MEEHEAFLLSKSCSKFTIPNIRENQNIFIETYKRSHDNFSQVMDQINQRHSMDDVNHEIQELLD
jgi:hypothetical protein